MHEGEKCKVDRRTFVGQSAGMVVGGLGCLGSLEGLRAALAIAMAPQKPLLTQESLDAFLAEARPSRTRQAMAKQATTDLGGFLSQHFVVDGNCQRVLSELSREDIAKINTAIQEGFAGQNELRVQVGKDPQAEKPRVGVERTTRAVSRERAPIQITTITVQTLCGYCAEP